MFAGKLFPNLAIIRGNTLIWDYTFSVFSMFNLQEIGLHRLTHIMKGTVVILRNPGKKSFKPGVFSFILFFNYFYYSHLVW